MESAASSPNFGRPWSASRKRYFRLNEFATDAVLLALRAPDIYAIWVHKRLGAKMREMVMVTVSAANACRFCGFVHSRWAEHVAVSAATVERLYALDPDAFEPRTGSALAYARARVLADFARIDPALEREALARNSEQELRDIELVARVMTLANRSTNNIDALLARIQGEPVEGSRALDEWVIGTASALGLITMVPALCVWRRQSPFALARDFRRFSRTLR
ncbi:MAG: carboxymuconolactone decarboxylase family protein [Bradymonadaceae bacterium]|nr:carboxymuconolactone decarboxylase family protein [Lujinxingiaceae bacterium]